MPRYHRSVPSMVTFLSHPVLIILIPIATFIFLFFAVPRVLFFTSNIFRPTISIKKSWDSLNMFLVLFAILCGVFARRNNDDTTSSNNKRHVIDSHRNTHRIGFPQGSESDSVNPEQWFGYSENAPACGDRTPVYTNRLRRSSSSYPDLRQQSPWENDDDQRFQFRFSDDIEINMYSKTASFAHRPRSKIHVNVEAKAIPQANETPPPAPPPPPPPPHISRIAYRTVEREEKKAKKKLIDKGYLRFETVSSSPPPPPPPPPKVERRKSNVTREIATALASLYNQKKRKKNQKNSTQSQPELQKRQSCALRPPSPPPLPPPPSSVFHNLFKKGTGKGKRIHSVPLRNAPKPPLPAKWRPSSPCHYDSSGGQSPLIPIPPPPPPPFKVAEWRFDVQGDYIQIRSAESSRCESPEPYYKCQSETVNVMDYGDVVRAGPAYCPTPDVNLKADTFIARLYDEWRLEKINSLRHQKQK